MNNLRLANCFENLQRKRQKALVPYITAGDPDPSKVVELLLAMADSGADIIELGIPFSDPMADGPVIQRSSERALKKGVNLQKCLNWVKEFRLQNKFTPIVLMGYANPIERFGIEDFAKEASNADVDGVLIVDYPPEEALNFCRLMKTHHIDVIFLLAPTTSIERLKHIARLGSGYLYYVSLRGVTGAKNIDISDVSNRLKIIREISPLPTVVGFGISTPKSAAEVATTPADGVVIGSAIIDKLDNANKLGIDPLIEISGFIKNIKKEINISTRALL